MEYLFMLDQKASVDFRVLFFLICLLDQTVVFLSVHADHVMKKKKKLGEGMKVILHHKAC